jgi:hypothetical protein
MVDAGVLVPTQLRRYYEALHALKEQEHTTLAELHAKDPARLIGRFVNSLKTVASYPAITVPFHGVRSERWKAEAGRPVTSTTSFTANLAAEGHHRVAGHPDLDFDFVDREIFPLRSTERALEARSTRVSIDLLLRDRDACPVVGELKVADDSPTYVALIQALAYAVELSGPDQLRRLAEAYGFRPPDFGPAIGIYLIGYNAPVSGEYRKASFAASTVIAEKLMADTRVNSVIKCIAYLEATSTNDGALNFERLF